MAHSPMHGGLLAARPAPAASPQQGAQLMKTRMHGQQTPPRPIQAANQAQALPGVPDAVVGPAAASGFRSGGLARMPQPVPMQAAQQQQGSPHNMGAAYVPEAAQPSRLPP